MMSCVEGRVEAVSPQGCRVNGIWHVYPRRWSGWRPAAGQAVRVAARLTWTIERLQPMDETRAESADRPAPSGSTQPLSGNGAGLGPSSLPSSPSSSQAGAGAGQRQRLAGIVAASNDRGVKLGETWYNYSRFTPLPESVRARLAPGARVVLEVDRQRWIAGAVVEADGPAPSGEEEAGWEDAPDEDWGLPSDRAADRRGEQ